jgi:hypothetical protein
MEKSWRSQARTEHDLVRLSVSPQAKTARPVKSFGVQNAHLPPAAGRQKAAATREGRGQTESFLPFRQLDEFEGNIPSVPLVFPWFRTKFRLKQNLLSRESFHGGICFELRKLAGK